MFIACTHELLIVATVAKIITGCRIVYDVQENYAGNIRYGAAFPAMLRPMLAVYVRSKEWILSGMCQHFFLAEKHYQQELAFVRRRCTVLENKVKRDDIVTNKNNRDKNKIRLLFSGTIAETTGAFIAIGVATHLNKIDPRVELLMMGYAAQPAVRSRLTEAVQHKSFISLKGIDDIVPHEEIAQAIASSDFGFISYPPNRSTAYSMPTKLFEYLGNRLPVLLIGHEPWVEYCKTYPAAVVFDPWELDPDGLLREMMQTNFYQHAPTDVYWESEEEKLLNATAAVISGLNNRSHVC